MNRKSPLMMAAAALLLGVATLPGAAVRTAEAADGVQAAATQEASPTLSDQFFRVEWIVSPGRNGDSRLTGYIYNESGEAAERVQLRISELDTSGRVVSTVTRPVVGTVPGEDRSYFDVQVPTSPSYQVAVQSFELVQEP